MTIGISTGGTSPTAAHVLKEQIEGLLPGNLEEILLWMDGMREELKGSPLPSPSVPLASPGFLPRPSGRRPLSREEIQPLLSLETEELP